MSLLGAAALLSLGVVMRSRELLQRCEALAVKTLSDTEGAKHGRYERRLAARTELTARHWQVFPTLKRKYLPVCGQPD